MNATAIIAIDEKGCILVQKEYSYPPNEWLYQFPGGAIEPNETPEQGALRELIEEASLTGSLKQALTAFGPGFANNLDIADNLTTLGSNILGAVPFGWINWIGQDGSDLTFQYSAIAGGVLSALSLGAQDCAFFGNGLQK